jgi:uncharacterized protein (TIGR02271 family)
MDKVSISDEEKRQIMNDLARGNPKMLNQEQSYYLVPDDKKIDAKDYQNFDNFAQREFRNEWRQLFNQSFHPDNLDWARLNQLKEHITTDIKQAKEAGKLRAGRIRELVQSAVSQVAAEFNLGSSDILLIVKDAISAVSENLQEKGGEIEEEITASIDGAIEGTMHSNPTATPSTVAASATTSEGVQRLELLKEVLRVNKQRVQTGEVTLRKEVIAETQTVEVPLMHEELVIEHRMVTGTEVATGEIGSGEEIRVQLSEERVTVEKLPVVSEEVIIGKRSVQQTEQVQETVRREELRTERQGDVIIDQGQDKPLS